MKKLLALVMVLAMVLSFSVVAFADDTVTRLDPVTDGTPSGDQVVWSSDAGKEPGTTPVAQVQGSTAFANDTTSGKTEFYLQIGEADSGKDPTIDKKGVIVDASGNKIVVNYSESTKTQVSVTVPLYVSMFAYAKNGEVIVPSSTAYQFSNTSTYTQSTEVTSIKKYYKASASMYELLKSAAEKAELFPATDPITNYKDATDDAFITAYINYAEEKTDGTISGTGRTPAKLHELAQQSGAVYSIDSDNKIVSSTDPVTLDDGLTYILYGNLTSYAVPTDSGSTTIYTAADDKGVANGNKGSEYVGKTAKLSGMAIDVVSMAAKPNASWTMVKSENLTAAGQMYMSIRGVDLSEVPVGGKSIAAEGWQIPAPDTTNANNIVAKSLALPISAAIAAEKNGSQATGANVVTVTYTIKATVEDETNDMSA